MRRVRILRTKLFVPLYGQRKITVDSKWTNENYVQISFSDFVTSNLIGFSLLCSWPAC